MSNEASEPLKNSEPEILPAPGELANKILALRAKGDAKNNPKKARNASSPRPTRSVVGAPSPEEIAAESLAAADEISVRPDYNPAEMHGFEAITHAATDERLENLAAGLEHLTELVSAVEQQVSEQNSTRDKAFDLLYEELSDYKNDFFYERLKPTLRALLFLLDSIEEFEREVEGHEKDGNLLPHEIIKANLTHFRDQLSEALLMSEMSPIEAADDKFDAKTQRAVQVVPVEAEKNNTVQRQIRGGWTLGGKILRPADVVVGKGS